jgi:hypothetical protein
VLLVVQHDGIADASHLATGEGGRRPVQPTTIVVVVSGGGWPQSPEVEPVVTGVCLLKTDSLTGDVDGSSFIVVPVKDITWTRVAGGEHARGQVCSCR